MPNKNHHNGYCHICNNYGKLTFEHIPPKAAFNNSAVKIVTGDAIINQISDINKE